MEAIIFRKCALLLVLILLNNQFLNVQSVGSSCTLKSGRLGVCTNLNDCDLWSLFKEGSELTPCGSSDYSKIICCPKPQSKSYQKCLEYSKIKCSHSRTKLLTANHLILNGEIVKSVEEYPHMALLGYGSPSSKITWQCGGTLISDQYILTAAHCLETREKVPVTVAQLGFLNKNKRNEFNTFQEFRILDRIKYPDRKVPKVYHDIALLKLDRPVKLSKSVLPACLHEDTVIPKAFVSATGWGQTERGSRTVSDDLMKVHLQQFRHDECYSYFPISRKLPEGVIEELQFCAGDRDKDTCYGDSGGPLQIKRKDNCMHSVVGITSIGIDCGIKPGIYTRISHYIPWIEKIVWPG